MDADVAPAFRSRDADHLRAIFTDMDGTLTGERGIAASTYCALERLESVGVAVIIVTGRPAGWGEALARLFPVSAVITENGGVTFVRGRGRRLERVYALPEHSLARVRRAMHRAASGIMKAVAGARLSSDSRYTEVDLAIDWNEDVRLGVTRAREIERALRAKGYKAVRSSVHVNFWPGEFDKLTASRALAKRLFPKASFDEFLYVGDALNDEPMFRGFPRSVGVAGIRRVWAELGAKPKFITREDGGKGFEEVALAVLKNLKRP